MSLHAVLLLTASCLADAKEVLAVPAATANPPRAGHRVTQTRPEYQGTRVRHSLYLPQDWSADAIRRGERWPVIVEYTGNYFPTSGSSGEVEDAALGYGLTAGRFIWLVLPFVSADKSTNETRWWGSIDATVAYAKAQVPETCERFGGDPDRVLICGFSRGAIAVNLIGLHDDEIARLWAGFVTHDHYDGVREWRSTDWGAPLEAYRSRAANRLARLQGRPALVCQNGSTENIRSYLSDRAPPHSFSFVDVNTREVLGPFPNSIAKHPHTDRWLLQPSDSREQVWQWIEPFAASE